MLENPADARRVPFSFGPEQDEFERHFHRLIQTRLSEKQSSLLPPENAYRYHHGADWQTHASSEPDDVGQMKVLSQESAIKHSDIVEHRVEKIDEFVEALTDAMFEQFAKATYETLAQCCDRSGNVVSAAKAKSPAAAFLEVMRKIEFGVDRNGKPTLPEVHAGSAAIESILADLAKQGPEFEAEVEAIKAEKIQAALARENERRAKFL